MPGPDAPARSRDAGIRVDAACGAFTLACTLLFAASAAATVVLGAAMPTMATLPMRGGWDLSTAWLPMCGRGGPVGMLSFLGMWTVMTVAMMLPSMAPNLWRYRCAAMRAGAARPTGLAAWAGTGYLLVWSGVGLAVAASGSALAALALARPALARAMPFAMAAVPILAGALQCTAWKARQLAHCTQWPAVADVPPTSFGRAWRCGLRLGRHCCASCAGLTAILLVGGVMDLRAMGVVTVAITTERLSPGGSIVARATGVLAMVAGLWRLTAAITAAG